MKIVLLPIDERPCNYYYPSIQPFTNDVEVILPPENLMSHLKNILDFNLVKEWLLDSTKDADYLIISLDALAYGGIIPSRIHHFSFDEIIEKTKIIEKIKQNNPKIKIFANELVERCPAYNDSFEEPDYYATYGLSINQNGQLLDKQERGILTNDELDLMKKTRVLIPNEIINDFENRRKINLDAILHNLDYAKKGIIDFFSIPLDDCASYGYTQMDIRKIYKYIKENNIDNVLIYPGADEVGLDLLSRCINDYYKITPKVFLYYADENGKKKIPQFEDRAEEIVLDLHLKVELCEQVSTKEEADIICIVNCGDGFIFTLLPEKRESMSHRNFDEIVELLKWTKENNKVSALADVGYINEGDYELFKYLYANNVLNFIDSYAGWNTNSNTFGTTMCGAVSFYHGRNIDKRNLNLFYRYCEDVLFMSDVRNELIDHVNKYPSPEVSSFNLKLYADAFSEYVVDGLKTRIKKYELFNIYDYNNLDVSFPWNRAFEIKLTVK